MNITFEFANETVSVIEGINAKGRPYKIRKQECFVHGNGPYPEKYSITLPDNVQAYGQGFYVPRVVFAQGRFGALEVARDLNLQMVKAPAAKAAA